MNATQIIGILLIVAGALGLVYQQFSFTKRSIRRRSDRSSFP